MNPNEILTIIFVLTFFTIPCCALIYYMLFSKKYGIWYIYSLFNFRAMCKDMKKYGIPFEQGRFRFEAYEILEKHGEIEIWDDKSYGGQVYKDGAWEKGPWVRDVKAVWKSIRAEIRKKKRADKKEDARLHKEACDQYKSVTEKDI